MLDRPQADRMRLPTALVFMGVSGCGKSTIAKLVAERMALRFVEGDDFHSKANVAKMKNGIALTDTDRKPWLEAIADVIDAARGNGEHLAVSCSALKRAYRGRLARGHDDVLTVYLEGSRELIAQRLAERQRHFMAPSLLDSQFADLEEPAPNERSFTITIKPAPDIIADAVVATLESKLV